MAFGVNLQGFEEVWGMWAAEAEWAKFWMEVVAELKNRCVSDIFTACVDEPRGFSRPSVFSFDWKIKAP